MSTGNEYTKCQHCGATYPTVYGHNCPSAPPVLLVNDTRIDDLENRIFAGNKAIGEIYEAANTLYDIVYSTGYIPRAVLREKVTCVMSNVFNAWKAIDPRNELDAPSAMSPVDTTKCHGEDEP